MRGKTPNFAARLWGQRRLPNPHNIMSTRIFAAMLMALAFAPRLAAQTVMESKNLDNWYVGLHAGVDAGVTHSPLLKSLNPLAGVRVGRWLTPVFGLAIEADAHFENKQAHRYGTCLATAVTSTNATLLGTTNVGNWIWGYRGQPRQWEVIAVYGFGWTHLFGTSNFRRKAQAGDYRTNFLTWKMGIDLACNFGAEKEWQLYVEPALSYRVSGNGQEADRAQLSINRANLGLTAGLIFKLPNRDGSRHFRLAPLRNQQELDRLNEAVNQLRVDNEAKDRLLADKNARIAEQNELLAAHDTIIPQQNAQIRQLQMDLLDARSRPTEIVMDMHGTNLQPSVLFRKGRTVVDSAQLPAIERIANYMKRNTDAHVEIRGYASLDENPDKADELSLQRAEAVKKTLTKRYKISADRITTIAMGATNQVYSEEEFNRIVTFNDNTR